jgi:2-phosphosulfolactate phosphatase
MIFDQSEFDIRCEWGEQGVLHLAPISDVVIIVDVLSFSTCVSLATARGAEILPFDSNEESAVEFARAREADLAGARGRSRYSLSPATFVGISAGARVVLPGINGSRLSLLTGRTATLAGCLRNAMAVAEAAARLGQKIAVIPAGERWKEDGSLRAAVEDLIGAGAIIRYLRGSLSPEADVAVGVLQSAEHRILGQMTACSSGKELIAMGFQRDLRLCADIDVDNCAPILKDGAYIMAEPVA